MKHGSLFSGIGGFDLAAEWMGWNNVFHCEWEDFPRKVLKYYWPNAISYGDIRETDFTIHRGQIDILTGGFPCQPFSTAGQRKGTEDDRHLWPEMLRAVREIAPPYVVGENVYGLLNWSGGMVFDQVHIDLENEGFQVVPVVLPACGVDAPHRRYRVWFVAYAGLQRPEESKLKTMGVEQLHESGNVAGNERNTWKGFPTQSPVCIGNDGFSSLLDGITFPKWRNESIKAAGNAIVPQVAYEIFKAIEKQLTLL